MSLWPLLPHQETWIIKQTTRNYFIPHYTGKIHGASLNTSGSLNATVMLGQPRRRRSDITVTLDQRLAFVGSLHLMMENTVPIQQSCRLQHSY